MKYEDFQKTLSFHKQTVINCCQQSIHIIQEVMQIVYNKYNWHSKGKRFQNIPLQTKIILSKWKMKDIQVKNVWNICLLALFETCTHLWTRTRWHGVIQWASKTKLFYQLCIDKLNICLACDSLKCVAHKSTMSVWKPQRKAVHESMLGDRWYLLISQSGLNEE